MIGKDAFGRFEVLFARCSACGWVDQACVRYDRMPEFPERSGSAPSLLGAPRRNRWLGFKSRHARTFGITCGCYGKLHRQVGHIEG